MKKLKEIALDELFLIESIRNISKGIKSIEIKNNSLALRQAKKELSRLKFMYDAKFN
jgi:hypothetical protein